ncbi:MAG: mechanosensitive ion channel domain-containing protein [Pseudomonadota bacterium]
MDFAALQQHALDWFGNNLLQLVITIAVVVLYLTLDRFSTPRLEHSADIGRFKNEAGTDAVRAARMITGAFGMLVLLFVWGIDLTAVLIFASTTITLLGVALFASWSILSSVTAYFILMLQPSFRRGNFIRVIEADNYIEGYIADLTLFHTRLITEDREIVVYPNSLMLGRPCLINPRDRMQGVGKVLSPRLPVPQPE